MSEVSERRKKLNAIELNEGNDGETNEVFANPEKERNDKIKKIDEQVDAALKKVEDNKIMTNLDILEAERIAQKQKQTNNLNNDLANGTSFACLKIHGTLFDKNKKKTYEGELYDGVAHGFGESYYPTEKIQYSGEWYFGKKNGKGKYWYYFSFVINQGQKC